MLPSLASGTRPSSLPASGSLNSCCLPSNGLQGVVELQTLKEELLGLRWIGFGKLVQIDVGSFTVGQHQNGLPVRLQLLFRTLTLALQRL
jgi:hypothetical protein